MAVTATDTFITAMFEGKSADEMNSLMTKKLATQSVGRLLGGLFGAVTNGVTDSFGAITSTIVSETGDGIMACLYDKEISLGVFNYAE